MPRLDVVQVVLRLSQCRSLNEIVSVLQQTTRDLISADGITVVLRDVDKCYYVEENSIGPLWKGKKFPLAACISGWCMLNKQQVVIPDIYADDRIPHDAYRPTFVKSLAMTPIRSANPVGAIGAYWASERSATQEELSVLQALGDSAAMALENAQLIEQLQETSRRKDAFLSMLAHELRNPLAPIRNGLHVLKLAGSDPEAVAETTVMMDRQLSHMTRLIDDLLDVARITTGKVTLKKSKIDLATLVRQCVEDHRPSLTSAGLTLKLELPLSKMTVDADPTRLTQVLSNLLDNARKFTPSGGAISVSLTSHPDTQSALLDISDTGIGISPTLLPRLFETFTQADASLDRTVGGLGLGLSVAHGLLVLHGGTISAHSDGLAKGARFSITLPTTAITQPAAPQPTAAPSAAKKKILIIEDNLDSAKSLQRIMKAYGFHTFVAYDGLEGVERAKAENPDVILCDIGLPKLDGFGVAQSLRAHAATAATRLIAVTGYGSEEDRDRAKSAGFDAHITKPVNLPELLAQVQRTARASDLSLQPAQIHA